MQVCAYFSKWAEEWKLERTLFLGEILEAKYEKLSESEQLTKIPIGRQSFVVSQIFNLSQTFGSKLQKQIERPFTLNEAIDFLAHSGLACFSGDWKKESAIFSKFLYRGACKNIPLHFCCDYWKHGAKGILGGLAPDVEFSRHQSIGHGNLGCLDYAYLSPMVHREYGTIPPGLRHLLEKLIKKMAVDGVKINLKGMNEDRLFVEIEGDKFPLDRERRELAFHLVKDALANDLPNLIIQDQNSNHSIYGDTSLQ